MVLDTEGRPALADLVQLTRTVDRVLIPCGPSGLEVRATVALWQDLTAQGADLARAWVVVTKAPPVGTVGQQARDALRSLGVLMRDVPDGRALAAWGDVLALADEVAS